MKRIVKYIVGLAAILVVIAAVVIIIRLNKTYPETNSYSNYTRTLTDEGMYYIKNNRLMFFDNASGKDTVVCNRADCNHASDECNAYVSGMAGEVMQYDGMVYFVHSESNIYTDDEGVMTYEGSTNLVSVGRDGDGRKTIYSADTGAVLSIQGMDGIIYFTAYVFIGDKINEYYNECSLYAYDLRWGRLKCIKTFAADDDHYNASLTIVGGQEHGSLYLNYSYYTKDEVPVTTLQQFDAATEDISEIRVFENESVSFYMTSGNKYVIYSITEDADEGSDGESSAEEKIIVVECDDSFQNVKEIARADNAWVDYFEGYMYIISSDYNKVFYDCETSEYYVSDTAFTQKGTYVSDVFDVDRDQNMVYVDATDYTGYKPGDLLPGDISDNALLEWDTFLGEYFVSYDELSEAEKAELTWLDIKE